MNILSARNLTMNFNGFCAVNGIDFDLLQGECFGFLGPNGAGKTTTIKMIYGALSPTSGELSIFGKTFQADRRRIKEKIGVVQQKDILEESLSAWDNLRIHGRHFGLEAGILRERGEKLLQLLGLRSRANEPIFRFSGGMKRRLSIAKGLINHPSLLLLDEPTTGLDPQARLLLWETIRRIKNEGISVLLSTHAMHEAEELCESLVILNQGKIIERGRPQDLILQHGCKNLEEVFLKLTGRDLRD